MTPTLKSSITVKQAREEVGRAVSQTNPTEQLRLLNLARQWIYSNQRVLGLDLSMSFVSLLSASASYVRKAAQTITMESGCRRTFKALRQHAT